MGRAAWSAFGAPDPRAIEAILAGDTSPLPFLADAFRRHLSEFPSVRNGLSKAESEALAKMSDGPVKPSWICGDWLTRHDDAWMGDATFFALLRALAKGPNPLIEPVTPLESEDRIVFQATEHRLTDLGRRVVAGQADRVAECGIDRHLGGVHLRGHDVAWRWDEAAGRLIHRPT